MLDLVLRGGKILDGTGSGMRDGDVCIRGERIVAIGDRHGEGAVRVIDVDGMLITPGFVDVHSHYDGLLLADIPDSSAVMQGVTTLVVGNCGFSPAPVNALFRDLLLAQMDAILGGVEFTWTTFGGYLDTLEAKHPPVNTAALVGHNAVRVAAMGFEMRQARMDELETMRRYVAEAMESGAAGLSTGLVYPPGTFANTSEVVELARVVKKYGGIYTSHIRNEANKLIDAVQEAITIGEESGVPVQISHCKVSGSTNWGQSGRLIQTIHDARARGLDVTGDQYPYIAGSTMLSTLLPPWAHEGGVPETMIRLRSAEMRSKMRHDMLNGVGDWWNPSRNTTWDKVMIAASPFKPEIEGKTLERLAQEAQTDPFTVLFDLLLETQSRILMVIFMMHEDDVKTIMRDPQIMVGTDALGTGSRPHPRAYGTYPRILSKYVREEHVIELPEAIRKMTSFPAQRFAMKDRGVLREGAYADVVVFDPKTVKDEATFEDPIQQPKGIPYVLVNGTMAIEDGKVTAARSGKVLRRAGA
ncbi:MAG: D-aminoacylase [Chloroflexi bacterium]|nr:D-aminoacylase [Chloroflexota bacterium]